MKFKRIEKTLLFLIILIFFLQSCASAAGEGRRLVDSLYASPGRLPINDLVADVEVYAPLKGQEAGTSMELASKDKIIFKKPNRLKIDSIIHAPGDVTDGRQMTIIRDGSQRWLYVSAGQYPVKKGPDEPSPTLTLPPFIQTYPQDADNVYNLAGQEMVGKVKAYVVSVTDATSGETTNIWIDTQKWVPIKLEKKIPDKKGGKEPLIKTCLYRDFKKLKDGRWFPFTIEIQEGGVTRRVVVYKAISINVGIQDHIFEPMKKFTK